MSKLSSAQASKEAGRPTCEVVAVIQRAKWLSPRKRQALLELAETLLCPLW